MNKTQIRRLIRKAINEINIETPGNSLVDISAKEPIVFIDPRNEYVHGHSFSDYYGTIIEAREIGGKEFYLAKFYSTEHLDTWLIQGYDAYTHRYNQMIRITRNDFYRALKYKLKDIMRENEEGSYIDDEGRLWNNPVRDAYYTQFDPGPEYELTYRLTSILVGAGISKSQEDSDWILGTLKQPKVSRANLEKIEKLLNNGETAKALKILVLNPANTRLPGRDPLDDPRDSFSVNEIRGRVREFIKSIYNAKVADQRIDFQWKHPSDIEHPIQPGYPGDLKGYPYDSSQNQLPPARTRKYNAMSPLYESKSEEELIRKMSTSITDTFEAQQLVNSLVRKYQDKGVNDFDIISNLNKIKRIVPSNSKAVLLYIQGWIEQLNK